MHYYYYQLYKIIHNSAVPGVNGSRINVMDASDTNCSTNGNTFTVLFNLSYITDSADCLATQLE